MRTQHEGDLPNLSAHSLPGPDTSTKLKALESHDPRLRLILEEAVKIGWPSAFTDDLYVHDTATLEMNPGTAMLWILQQNGTHLYPLQCESSHEVDFYRRVIDYWSGDHKLNAATRDTERARYYVVSPTGIEHITAREARDHIKVRPPP